MPQTAKLFTNGGSQAVRLPAEFRFEGEEVNIRHENGGIFIWKEKPSWNDFLKLQAEMLAAGEIPDDFLADIRDQSPPRNVNL